MANTNDQSGDVAGTRRPEAHQVDSATISAFQNVVNSRRSTRIYDGEPVPDEVMHNCIDLALLSPNSSNLQPWQFYRVKSEAAKKELVSYCLGQPAAATAPELVVCVSRLDTWDRNRQLMLDQLQQVEGIPDSVLDYYNKIVPLAFKQGPLYLIGWLKKLVLNLLAIRKPMPRGPAGKADMRVWAHKSTALACQTLMLALRAHGYDSCPMEGMDPVRIRKMLKLPRGAEVCMVISAGKRDSKGIYGPRIRFDRSLFVFEV